MSVLAVYGSFTKKLRASLELESTLERVSNTKCGNIGNDMNIVTSCDTSDDTILLGELGAFGIFNGDVECSSSSSSQEGRGGGDTTIQSSSMAAGTSQDGDSDGIPDSSDKCTLALIQDALKMLHNNSSSRRRSYV